MLHLDRRKKTCKCERVDLFKKKFLAVDGWEDIDDYNLV